MQQNLCGRDRHLYIVLQDRILKMFEANVVRIIRLNIYLKKILHSIISRWYNDNTSNNIGH